MKVLAHMEEPTPTTVSLLDAIRDLNKTWNSGVKPQTISNCFRKAGFAKGELMQNATTDDWDEEDDLPLSELKQIWITYRTATGTDNVSFDDYVDIDDGVQTMGFPTDEDILDSVMENLVPSGKDLEEDVSSESEVETTTETIPTFNQAYSAIQTLRNFTSTKENVPNAVHASINVVEHFIEKEKWSVFKQKKNYHFFQ
ncbi:tigger transposable element-derived protein 6-like [Bactrocera neohumeralis]|uniref:tigger transposable element-derived protein 6-like n=1 Tax=Bactrocera neohumeralis TaxID=98809 RepID=UPI002165C92D|nr:tigger transposable element-derived protein 6-like [Bactrocera neohumeralis]